MTTNFIAAITYEASEVEESMVKPGTLADDSQVARGRAKQLEKLEQFSAVQVVPRDSAHSKPLTTRWVERADDYEVKSRLTVHGFKQQVDPHDEFLLRHTSFTVATHLARDRSQGEPSCWLWRFAERILAGTSG